MFNELNWRLTGDGELAEIRARVLRGEPLDAAETTRFTAFVNAYVEGFRAQLEAAMARTGMRESGARP